MACYLKSQLKRYCCYHGIQVLIYCDDDIYSCTIAQFCLRIHYSMYVITCIHNYIDTVDLNYIV